MPIFKLSDMNADAILSELGQANNVVILNTGSKYRKSSHSTVLWEATKILEKIQITP